MNPDDYIITRKRKKYKFAKFANAKNCYEYEEWNKRGADILEVAAGTGLFAVELAKRYPNKVIVAVDVKADRLQKGAYRALEEGVKNVYFVRARADQLTDCITKHTVEKIWITFPDPFPKRRSERRRMTHPYFLTVYKTLLAPNGRLYIKHDDQDFFCWSIEQLVTSGWVLNELAFDLHESTLSEEYKIMTTYEQRWTSEQKPIGCVQASVRHTTL